MFSPKKHIQFNQMQWAYIFRKSYITFNGVFKILLDKPAKPCILVFGFPCVEKFVIAVPLDGVDCLLKLLKAAIIDT